MIPAISAAVVLGLCIGGVIGWLIAQSRARGRDIQTQSALAAARQEAAGLSQSFAGLQDETARTREQLAQERTANAVAQAQLDAARRSIDEQKALLQDAQSRLREAFSSLSEEALSKNSQAFLQLARENYAVAQQAAANDLEQRSARIDSQIKPLRELMGLYQQRLGELEQARTESYGKLQQQIGTLAESQRALNSQTHQLTTALSQTNTRGRWGEVALRRVVELAGMTRWCDFVEQASVSGDDGIKRPDMVVQLPGNRKIVIDSKAPGSDLLDAAAAADEAARESSLQRYARQVRDHCRELSRKGYWSQFEQSPEFVVMFLPGEAFLYAAVKLDHQLIEDALQSNIIIATPTTLVALLKTVEFGWRQEQATENAQMIRKLGAELYERIATMADHFDKLGRSLNSTMEAYNGMIGSVERRVLATARKLNELGAAGSGKELASPQSVETRSRQLTIS